MNVELLFSLMEAFKGDASKLRTRLTTARSEATCGVSVPAGRHFVFFVSTDGRITVFRYVRFTRPIATDPLVKRVRDHFRHKRGRRVSDHKP